MQPESVASEVGYIIVGYAMDTLGGVSSARSSVVSVRVPALSDSQMASVATNTVANVENMPASAALSALSAVAALVSNKAGVSLSKTAVLSMSVRKLALDTSQLDTLKKLIDALYSVVERSWAVGAEPISVAVAKGQAASLAIMISTASAMDAVDEALFTKAMAIAEACSTALTSSEKADTSFAFASRNLFRTLLALMVSSIANVST
jgi:hypothetical protein